jgi:hypothetical protein
MTTHPRSRAHNNHTITIILLAAFLCGGCIDVTITNPGPDDGESLALDTGTEPTTTGMDSSSTDMADSTTGGGAPCHDSALVDGVVVSECCPESLGNCTDWCANHGFGECLETIASVGDAMCGLPVSHEDYCGIDLFNIVIASEMSVQCVCAELSGTGTGTSTTDSGTESTTGECEQIPFPENQPECVPCTDATQCRASEDCICASEFGTGVCLPVEWNECTWGPCDESCLYVDGAWICALPGC